MDTHPMAARLLQGCKPSTTNSVVHAVPVMTPVVPAVPMVIVTIITIINMAVAIL